MEEPDNLSGDRLDDWRSEASFIVALDNMIDSTLEFIADDEITPRDDPEGRYLDWICFAHTRRIFLEVYATVYQEDS